MKSFFDIGCLAVNTDLKMILLRSFTSPKDLLNLLHETGHAWTETPESSVTRRHLDKEVEIAKEGKNTEQEVALMRETAKFLSASERDAWAWALKTYRKIEKETKTDFSEIFPSFEEIKTYINRLLLSYRWTYSGFARLYDPGFADELKKYFDKGAMEKRKTRGKIL